MNDLTRGDPETLGAGIEPLDTPVVTSPLPGGEERLWRLKAIRLAGLSWPCAGEPVKPVPTFMLHGWLDNCLSFCKLAPALAALSDVHTLDMAGHGKSGHRPAGQSYLLMDYVGDLAELVDRYVTDVGPDAGDGRVDLVGHSLGGIVASLYAAAFPERVRRLVMIDSLGAISRPVEETVPQLRKALRKRLAGSGRAVTYPDLATAAKAREGGFIPLSHESSLTLVARNMTQTDDGFVWHTDARLRHPSSLMMTEPQVRAVLSAIETPSLFVRAADGLLASRKGMNERVDCLKGLTVATVPGGHHCHLEGDTSVVDQVVADFLAAPDVPASPVGTMGDTRG
ncbi:alpha/beta fold hydrolase [Marinobacter sp. C2H3]|uniref:alpha/beta fold hydrolase n=1 Tax=Marinobacter sp. C2H3 TaxID=3119003 RepID=UPI00300EF5A9